MSEESKGRRHVLLPRTRIPYVRTSCRQWPAGFSLSIERVRFLFWSPTEIDDQKRSSRLRRREIEQNAAGCVTARPSYWRLLTCVTAPPAAAVPVCADSAHWGPSGEVFTRGQTRSRWNTQPSGVQRNEKRDSNEIGARYDVSANTAIEIGCAERGDFVRTKVTRARRRGTPARVGPPGSGRAVRACH